MEQIEKRKKMENPKVSLKACKNHYKKGMRGTYQLMDACGESLPYCCEPGTASAGYCRKTKEQCSFTGITDPKSRGAKTPIFISETKLSPEEKESFKYKAQKEGRNMRKDALKQLQKQTKCSRQVLEFLGPYSVTDIHGFYVNALDVEESNIEGLDGNLLCKALNKTLQEYNEMIEKYPDMKDISAMTYMKKYAFDNLFELVKRKYVYNV